MADLETLLARTSRTFAVAIPLLPARLRREVAAAYLLLRIADTLEDANTWPPRARIAALSELAALLASAAPGNAGPVAAGWVQARPCEDADHLMLLSSLPEVLAEIESFGGAGRPAILHHTRRVVAGMAEVMASSGAYPAIALASEAELCRYCYIVAGIVGELLTDLFIEAAPDLARVEPVLREHAAAFGEGLQLVNILKDAEVDVRAGRAFIPPSVGSARVVALAHDDLERAGAYIAALQTAGAPRGIVAFCALPVLLARATLDELARRGVGAKVGRDAVAHLLARMNAALDNGACALLGSGRWGASHERTGSERGGVPAAAGASEGAPSEDSKVSS